MNWSDLLGGAVALAREGVQVSASQLFWQGQRASLIERLPSLHALCKTEGRLLQAGDRLRQPALANSLEQLARRGPQDFYQGELAEAFGAAFADLGCGLTVDDLRATQAHWLSRSPYATAVAGCTTSRRLARDCTRCAPWRR